MSSRISSPPCVLFIALLLSLPLLSGCAQYVTPGLSANLSNIVQPGSAPEDIQARLDRKPAAAFPARIAVLRLQAPHYRSHSYEGQTRGKYSVVTYRTQDETAQFEKMQNLHLLAGIAPMNSLVLPQEIQEERDLRLAAANLQADMLLLYTFDTSFNVKDHDIGPLGPITLGFLPNQEAFINSTASCVIMDVRTGFIYGLAEASARKSSLASTWSTTDRVDELRLEAEHEAFRKLADQFPLLWKNIVAAHVPPKP